MGDALAPDDSSTDRLWVRLSALGEGNVFAVLPELFRKMITQDALMGAAEPFDMIFPSDDQWKEKIYYRLVEQQRKADAAVNDEMLDSTHQQNQNEQKLHDWNIIPKNERIECDEAKPNKIGRKRLKQGPNPITWTVSDLAKAGCLLHSPPIGTSFEDEQEMRRVYTLIYDVYRYKNVLMQALNDINFFQIFEQLQASVPIVWLLFYDLYHRSFKKRETSVREQVARLFHHARLSFAENALWVQRVKLAAAVARLRIKYNALSLMDLLPSHLRGDKVNKETQNIPVSVWVNNQKFRNVNDIRRQIEHALKAKLVEDVKDLGPNTYKWDRHCPLTVAFHYSMRTQLAKSNLVRNHKLIVQDRSFCVGAATFWKVVEDLELSGSVIQTHVNSPRSTAYLANLLSQNEKIKKLMAFSAGRRKIEYENYLHELGMTNVVIYSDKLVDFGFESPCMEEVVAVYATPPNSYSAVSDPIDLVCSRGGDLSMLEILTESEDTLEGRNRVTKILEEQRKTLKFAMSRPQIQVVLYETHSELDVENCDMVKTTLNEINRLAKLHHASLQGLISSDYMSGIQMPSELLKEINNNEEDKKAELDEDIKKAISSEEVSSTNIQISTGDFRSESPDELRNVHVPETDLFDTPDLPCLCPEETNCKLENGCYLALIQRKQVLKLDNKYMIQMAEQRGLFGSNSTNTSKQKGSKQSRKKQQSMKQEVKQKRTRKKLKDFEVASENDTDDEVELETEETEDKVNLTPVNETEDDDASKAGGILGNLTKNQIQTLISPYFKNCCEPCLTTTIELSQERYILPEQNDHIPIRDNVDTSPSLNHQQSCKETETESLTSAQLNDISPKACLSQDSEKNPQESQLIASSVTPRGIFETDLEDLPGSSTQKPKQASQSEYKNRCDKNISAQRIETINKHSNKILILKKKDSVTSSLRFLKYRLKQLTDENSIKSMGKSSSTSSNGYEMIVRPSGTFNINAGPVRIFKYGLNLRRIRGKLTEEIINRIAMPTEASKIRSLREECLPTCRRTEGGTVTRDFICECCKRRNSQY